MRSPSVWTLLLVVICCGSLGRLGQVQAQECAVGDDTCSALSEGAERQQQPSMATSKKRGVKVARGSNAQGSPPVASLADCADRYPQCQEYARIGECEANPGWMIVNCPQSCHSCHLLDPKARCDRSFLNISSDPIYAPGEMDQMFRSIEQDFGHLYDIEVLSRDPWVVLFHNFVNDDEGEAILQTVEGTFEKSTDTGSSNAFGEAGRILSQSRTSSNAWCRQSCRDHPFVRNVIGKMEAVTRIPSSHYESLQVLNYEPGQYYRTHHDMAPRQARLSSGPRILTFFLYLSDVEEGGETAFPQLEIAVKPRKGSALLWPSTFSDNILQQDPRTEHEARPVIKGVKLAANSWIHSHDFEKSNLWGCTGSFDYL